VIASFVSHNEWHGNFQPITYSTQSLTSEVFRLSEWAQKHYRYRIFNSGERIPVRSGLLYFVQHGIVRLVGTSNSINTHLNVLQLPQESHKIALETFLGFVGERKPFEVVAQPPFGIQAYAHIDQTSVFWMYWHELDNWHDFRQKIMDEFRRTHQRQLLWLGVLRQQQTVDRLRGFLTLMVEEFGTECPSGYYLPFQLTHTQIGSAIGATRVTVNRLMKKFCKEGLIRIEKNNLICLTTIQRSNN